MRQLDGRILRRAGSLALFPLGVLASLVLLACSGRSAASGGPAASSTTDPVTRTFSAYTGTGALAVPVSTRTRGSCWTHSIALPAAAAYRCLAGNTIEDPCFAAPGAAASATPDTVACISAPWADATVLSLTAPLPSLTGADGPLPARRLPWAIALANGARCVLATGTVPTVAGVALDYTCGSDANGADAGVAAGTSQPRTAEYGAPAGGRLTPVAVSVIWPGPGAPS